MGFLSRAVFEAKSYNTLDLFKEIYGGRSETATGKEVNVKAALQVSAVIACVRVIGEGIAQVPLKLIQESADGKTRLPAKGHHLYNILSVRPNSYQTSFEFREMLAWHVVLTGNFYAFKNVVFGKIVELLPFEPNQVVVTRADNGVITYEVTAQSGSRKVFPAESIWHVRGPSWNSWMGLEAVQLAREAIGLAMATEEQHARMHKHGVRTSGVYSVEGSLSPEQYKGLKAWIDAEMGGSANAGKAMVLDRGAKWLNTSMTGVDSQHLETRKYQVEEICRFFRVMPIMVGYSDKAATYASAEQMFLAHVVHTMSPWWQRLEQSIDANLLTEKDRKAGLYSQFVEEGMLRGDSAATSEFLTKLTTNGIMTRNEARAKLDLNPLDGLEVPLTPANMIIGTEMPEPPAAADTSAQDAAKALQFDALERKLDALRQPAQPVVVNNNLPEQRQQSLSVELRTADIERSVKSAIDTMATAHADHIKAIASEMPITINMPVQPTQPAPQVTVNVEAPQVSFEAIVPATQVVVNNAFAKTAVQTVQRDKNDEIVSTTTQYQ